MKIFSFIKNMIKRKGTHISSFSVLTDTEVHEATAIRPLVKMERSKIGKCSSIGTLSAAYDCEIGKFCNIARECYIGGASHPLDYVSTSVCFYLKNNYTGVCFNEYEYDWHTKTTIGNDVWLGIRTIVRGGVSIADGAVIGAGSVVTKDVGPYEIWAGNPARFIRKRFDDDTIEILLKSKWWDWDDEKLRDHGKLFTNVDEFVDEIKNKSIKY